MIEFSIGEREASGNVSIETYLERERERERESWGGSERDYRFGGGCNRNIIWQMTF
jgi:hypothetical protein